MQKITAVSGILITLFVTTSNVIRLGGLILRSGGVRLRSKMQKKMRNRGSSKTAQKSWIYVSN